MGHVVARFQKVGGKRINNNNNNDNNNNNNNNNEKISVKQAPSANKLSKPSHSKETKAVEKVILPPNERIKVPVPQSLIEYVGLEGMVLNPELDDQSQSSETLTIIDEGRLVAPIETRDIEKENQVENSYHIQLEKDEAVTEVKCNLETLQPVLTVSDPEQYNPINTSVGDHLYSKIRTLENHSSSDIEGCYSRPTVEYSPPVEYSLHLPLQEGLF